MANLTPQQQDALDWVATTDERYRKAKYNARSEMKRLIEERVAEHAAARNTAVAQAFEMGVPKARIGLEGLHTTSPNTVYEILEKHRELMALTGVDLAVKPRDRFSWGTRHIVNSAKQFVAWVLVDGEEFESTFVNITNVGYAVNAFPGVAGAVAYRVAKGEDLSHPNDTREQYPELIAWIEANPPEVTA